jgi:hypothetical protein
MYRTADTRNLKGLRKAERLQREGWKIVSVGFSTIQFFKPKVKKAEVTEMYDKIQNGSRVTIVNRFYQSRTGRAIMLGPAGWVLNMGGRHGTPGIATPENVVKVTTKKPRPDWAILNTRS